MTTASPAEAHFRAVAPTYMTMLLSDFPRLGVLDAAAVFGNAGHESKGLTDDQEDAPTVAGSKGGRNWMQWTGPRRRLFEAYCARNHLDPDSDAAAYKWLFLELSGQAKGSNEAAAIDALVGAKTLDDKVVAFSKAFLRPGTPHYESRKAWAKIAMDAFSANRPTPAAVLVTGALTTGLIAPGAATTAPEPETPASEAPLPSAGTLNFPATETKMEDFEQPLAAPTPKRATPILDAIRATTEAALSKAHVPIADRDVPLVTSEVTKAITPIVQNATNSEPIYKSRILWGLIVAAVGLVANRFGLTITSDDLKFVVDNATVIIGAGGLLYAAFGRIWGSRMKPLGK